MTRFGRFGEEKNEDVLLHPGVESQFVLRSAHSLVVVTAPPKIPNLDSRPKIPVILKTNQTYSV